MDDIDLLVCDMAGTTVEEGGLVYQLLRKSMTDDGLVVSEADMHPWHGAKKEAVIAHFCTQQGTPASGVNDRVARIGEAFLAGIDDAYFQEASPIDHIDLSLINFFRQLKDADVKIALDTGYPPNVQNGLIKKLGLDKVIDSHVSSYDVSQGRPYPYMIFTLMERLGIEDVKRVAKVGDSVRDIEMGKNAGCGLVIGVESGADTAEKLLKAGADIVLPRITDLPIPGMRGRKRESYPVDLS